MGCVRGTHLLQCAAGSSSCRRSFLPAAADQTQLGAAGGQVLAAAVHNTSCSALCMPCRPTIRRLPRRWPTALGRAASARWVRAAQRGPGAALHNLTRCQKPGLEAAPWHAAACTAAHARLDRITAIFRAAVLPTPFTPTQTSQRSSTRQPSWRSGCTWRRAASGRPPAQPRWPRCALSLCLAPNECALKGQLVRLETKHTLMRPGGAMSDHCS